MVADLDMKWKLIAAGCYLLIVVASLLPGQWTPSGDVNLSENGFVEHALIYALLGFTVCKGFGWSRALIILGLVCLISICFEWIQGSVLQRTFSPDDILANVLGVTTGITAAGLSMLLLALLGKENRKH